MYRDFALNKQLAITQMIILKNYAMFFKRIRYFRFFHNKFLENPPQFLWIKRGDVSNRIYIGCFFFYTSNSTVLLWLKFTKSDEKRNSSVTLPCDFITEHRGWHMPRIFGILSPVGFVICQRVTCFLTIKQPKVKQIHFQWTITQW